MSDKINNSEIDYNTPSNELVSSTNPISNTTALSFRSIIGKFLFSKSISNLFQTKPIEPASNIEDIKTIIDVKLNENTEPIKILSEEEIIDNIEPIKITVQEELIENNEPINTTIIEEIIENTEHIKTTIEEEIIENTESIKITIEEEINENTEPIKITIEEEIIENTEPIKITIEEENIENIEPIKITIEEENIENIEPIKTTIDLEPTEIIISPNNIEPNNVSIISGSDDVIKSIKANSIVLEQESKQEKIVSSIELEEINNNKTQCCLFFQYPKWRK